MSNKVKDIKKNLNKPADEPNDGMQLYLGVKMIQAKPMNAGEAYKQLHRTVSTDKSTEGYLVEYEDNYQSWSPKDVFDKAYERIDGMTFGLALAALQKGHKVTLPHWIPGGVHLMAQLPDENSLMTEPYIAFCLGSGKKVPYAPTHIEMFSDAWIIFDEIEEVVETDKEETKA